MTTPTCSTCRHWKSPERCSRSTPGTLAHVVGTCALGGPEPRDGSSDACACETCEKHAPKEA